MDNTASLYEDDFVAWSEQQAAALRAVAARPDLTNSVDWANVIEEIECLGRSEWKGVAGHLRNALAHILKEVCDPDSLSKRAWSAETNNSLDEAREDFRASMRQHIDIEVVWSRAFKQAAQSLEPYGVVIPPGIPQRSPFALDELLDEGFTHGEAIKTLHERLAESRKLNERTLP